jgi:hypothetical protein
MHNHRHRMTVAGFTGRQIYCHCLQVYRRLFVAFAVRPRTRDRRRQFPGKVSMGLSRESVRIADPPHERQSLIVSEN